MLTLDELSKNIAAYRAGCTSLEDFYNWFEDNSAGAYGVPDLHAACIAVDAAFSEYYYDHVGEQALKEGLESAVRRFVGGWETVSPGLFLVRQKEPENRNVASGKTEVLRKPPMPEVEASLGSSVKLVRLEAAPA